MHEIKSHILQVNRIESKEELIIALQNILRCATFLVPGDDYDLVPKWYVDGLVVGLLDDRGSYDPTITSAYPTTGGSGSGGAIMKGDLWYISEDGTIDGIPVLKGYSVRSLADSPGQVTDNWNIMSIGVGYIPENIENKASDLTSPDNIKYPTTLAVVAALALKANLESPTFTGIVTSPAFVGPLTGNASTATLAANSTFTQGLGSISFNDSIIAPTANQFLVYDNTNNRYGVTNAGVMQTALGITGGPFLPLTGGTLTGSLSGTSATFTGNLNISAPDYSTGTRRFLSWNTSSGLVENNSVSQMQTFLGGPFLPLTGGTLTGALFAPNNIIMNGGAEAGMVMQIGGVSKWQSYSDVASYKLHNYTTNSTSLSIDNSTNAATFTGSGTFGGDVIVNSAGNMAVRLNAGASSYAQLIYSKGGTQKWNAYNHNISDAYELGNASGSVMSSLTQTGNLTIAGSGTFGGKIQINDGGNTTVAALGFGSSTNGISYPTTNQINIITNSATRIGVSTTAIDLTLPLTGTSATFNGKALITANGTDGTPALWINNIGSNNTALTVQNTTTNDAVVINHTGASGALLVVAKNSSSKLQVDNGGNTTISGGDFTVNGVDADSKFTVYNNYAAGSTGFNISNNSGTNVITANGNTGAFSAVNGTFSGSAGIGGAATNAKLDITGDNSTRLIYGQGGATFPSGNSLVRFDAGGATVFDLKGSGALTATSFTGAGTGLTGTASGLTAGKVVLVNDNTGSGEEPVLFKRGTDVTYNGNNNVTIENGSGRLTASALKISTAPTTSAGSYDILTRNTSTGIVEKVPLIIESDTYTPTLTNGTNVVSSTGLTSSYIRVGNEVSGYVSFSALGNAPSVNGTINVSLPIPSNFSSASNASGSQGLLRVGEISGGSLLTFAADPTNNNFLVNAFLNDVGARVFRIQFQYTIIP